MQHGLCFPNGGMWLNPHTAGTLAALAERSGWDGVFLEDYVVWQGDQGVPTYDPWVILAAMALQTERVRIGTTITPLARRRVWKVARETVTLDHLSRGRLILGVGLGDLRPVDANFGEVTDARGRARLLDEGLAVLAGLWSAEPFSYQGDFYHVQELTFRPRPVQLPRIPIWVGGGWPRRGPTQRALRWDGSVMYVHTTDGSWQDWTPDEVRKLAALAESERREPGPFDIVVGGRRRGDDWEAERALIRSLAEAGATWWLEYLPQDLGDVDLAARHIERGPLR